MNWLTAGIVRGSKLWGWVGDGDKCGEDGRDEQKQCEDGTGMGRTVWVRGGDEYKKLSLCQSLVCTVCMFMYRETALA